MPSKKKKYNARFPPARIKKIMQMDDEVGKVAQAVPVIISRTLELFVESLLKKAEVVTVSRNAKTLTPSHLKQCIQAEQRFDFLKDLVENIPDSQGDEDCSTPAADTPRSSTSNSPFVFPVVSRGATPSTSSTSTTRSSASSVSTPPVIVANNAQPNQNPQPYVLQPVPPFYQPQPPYESVIMQAHSSSSSSSSIPQHPNTADVQSNSSVIRSQQQTSTVNTTLPILSHFEYLPNNLHYASSTTTTSSNNNGINFSLQHQRDPSASNNGPSSTGVIVSPPGFYQQRKPSLHE